MQLSQEALRTLEEAARHEHFGRFDRAERCYLEVLEGIDPNDRSSLGTILNNLGVNSTNALDADKGIGYFSKAIEQLDGLKGEAMLQNAHAHWNIARLHILRSNPAAVEFGEKALKLYKTYPFTSQVDMADAHICRVLALVVAKRAVKEKTLGKAWKAARAVPFKSLNLTLATEFLSLLLSMAADLGGAAGSKIRRQAAEWAEPSVFNSIAGTKEERGRSTEWRDYHFVVVVNEKGETTELLTLPSSRGPVLVGYVNPDNFRAGLHAAGVYVKEYLKATGKDAQKLRVEGMSFNAPSPNALHSMLSDTGLVHFDATVVLEGDALFYELFDDCGCRRLPPA